MNTSYLKINDPDEMDEWAEIIKQNDKDEQRQVELEQKYSLKK